MFHIKTYICVRNVIRKWIFEYFVIFILKDIMKPLFTEEALKLSKSEDMLPCECYICEKTFYLTKHEIQRVLNPNHNQKGNYCSKECQNLSQVFKITMKCGHCGKEFQKLRNQVKKSKNHFCSKSCAATYHNTHKTKGIRRSKLELYIENKLKHIYPELKIEFNKTDTINAELDIYIPSIKIAFELNGIYHYEPIFGDNKLYRTKNNDQRKFQACLEKNIELCVIDTSHQKYFKEQTSKKFLEIITNIINQKLVPPLGNDPSPIG